MCRPLKGCTNNYSEKRLRTQPPFDVCPTPAGGNLNRIVTKSLERSLARETDPDADGEHHAPEITYDEQFYPARPKRFRPSRAPLAAAPDRRPPRRRRRDRRQPRVRRVARRGVDAARRQPARLAALRPGQHVAEPVRAPGPARGARARVGLVHRLPAVVRHPHGRDVTCPRSPTAGCGRRSARSASTRVHTGPVKQAGGLNGRRLTPSIDGHFDRISMEVDPEFGTEERVPHACARPPPSTRAR